MSLRDTSCLEAAIVHESCLVQERKEVFAGLFLKTFSCISRGPVGKGLEERSSVSELRGSEDMEGFLGSRVVGSRGGRGSETWLGSNR